MAECVLVRVSKVVSLDSRLLIYLPRRVVEFMALKKGDEVRLMMDVKNNRLLIEKNEALRLKK
jgi:antitoxin component of MazEF toxin-antitoxin module